MDKTSAAAMRETVRAWAAASAVLEELRRQRLRTIDTAECIDSLDDAFESSLAHARTTTSSGFVAQQAVFVRLRDEGSLRPGR